MSLAYEIERDRIHALKRTLRAHWNEMVDVIFDPRVSDSPNMRGRLVAASSETEICVIEVSEADGEDTLRFRIRTENGWLLRVPMNEILDVVRG